MSTVFIYFTETLTIQFHIGLVHRSTASFVLMLSYRSKSPATFIHVDVVLSRPSIIIQRVRDAKGKLDNKKQLQCSNDLSLETKRNL